MEEQVQSNLNKKTSVNWKYIFMVAGLAVLAGGGILAYQYWWLPGQETELPNVVLPPKQDETADWLTYRNEEYGFEFKYPSKWAVKPDFNPCATTTPLCVWDIEFVPDTQLSTIPKDNYWDYLKVEVKERIKEGQVVSLEDWVFGRGEGRDDWPYTRVKIIVVGGIETYLLLDPATIGGPQDWQVVFVPKGDFTYKLVTTFDRELFELLLSNFKFIETNETSDLDLKLARKTLIDFYSLLNEGNYDEAVKYYGSSWGILRDWNPILDPNDFAGLLKQGCEVNGLNCLKVENVASGNIISTTSFTFVVSFLRDDGTLFERGPCCGATEEEMPTQREFGCLVEKIDGDFFVMSLPVYTP